MTGDDGGSNASKTFGTTNTIDTNSPYYIHISDYPRQMHVNDVLTNNNYNDWSQEMLNFLFAKSKVGFINGTIKKPEATSPNYMIWMRCDAMLKDWLTTTMEKGIKSNIKYINTGFEIGSDLQERFGKESAPRAYELKQSLTITNQEGTSVSMYYMKLRSIWDELQSISHCTCEIRKQLSEAKEKEILYKFLIGLNSEFTTIRT